MAFTSTNPEGADYVSAFCELFWSFVLFPTVPWKAFSSVSLTAPTVCEFLRGVVVSPPSNRMSTGTGEGVLSTCVVLLYRSQHAIARRGWQQCDGDNQHREREYRQCLPLGSCGRCSLTTYLVIYYRHLVGLRTGVTRLNQPKQTQAL